MMMTQPYCPIHQSALNAYGLCSLCISGSYTLCLGSLKQSDSGQARSFDSVELDMSPMAKQISDLNIAVGVLQQEHREQWVKVQEQIQDISRLTHSHNQSAHTRMDKLANMFVGIECSICKGRGRIGSIDDSYTCPKCNGEG